MNGLRVFKQLERCQRNYDAMLPPDYWDDPFEELEEEEICQVCEVCEDDPCTCRGDN